MKAVLQKILAVLARAILQRYQPRIVGITGSVGKTSAKEAVFTVLRTKYRVRRSDKNYNTEIGVPLTILGIPHYGRHVFKWAFALIRAAVRAVFRVHGYPEILVLEMGADRPGDIGYLVALAPPHVGVITAIGEVPVHVEFFAGPDDVAREKGKLIAALPADGYALLHADDRAVMGLAGRTRARRLTYGFGEGASLRIRDYALAAGPEPGIRFVIEHRGQRAPVALANCFGRQQAYAAAAAAAVGIAFGMGLEEIASVLAGYTAPPGRLKLLRGNKGSIILDDTYNASPASTSAALEVLRELPARHRIAVLGDMLELGRYTEAAHRALGTEAARSCDMFIGVGERMKFALEEARANGTSKTLWCADSRQAGRALEGSLAPGTVVLIKGSQSMRMERAVEEVMAEPERATELLVRQSVDWRRRP